MGHFFRSAVPLVIFSLPVFYLFLKLLRAGVRAGGRLQQEGKSFLITVVDEYDYDYDDDDDDDDDDYDDDDDNDDDDDDYEDNDDDDNDDYGDCKF